MRKAVTRSVALFFCGMVGAVFLPGARSSPGQLSGLESLDRETLERLFAEAGVTADGEELPLMSFEDPSADPEDDTKPVFESDCAKAPYGCKEHEFCPIGDGATCIVTGCGDGKCAWCDLFGNLVYDGYCLYGCVQGAKYWGYGFNLRIRFAKKWNGFQCFPFPTKKK